MLTATEKYAKSLTQQLMEINSTQCQVLVQSIRPLSQQYQYHLNIHQHNTRSCKYPITLLCHGPIHH